MRYFGDDYDDLRPDDDDDYDEDEELEEDDDEADSKPASPRYNPYTPRSPGASSGAAGSSTPGRTSGATGSYGSSASRLPGSVGSSGSSGSTPNAPRYTSGGSSYSGSSGSSSSPSSPSRYTPGGSSSPSSPGSSGSSPNRYTPGGSSSQSSPGSSGSSPNRYPGSSGSSPSSPGSSGSSPNRYTPGGSSSPSSPGSSGSSPNRYTPGGSSSPSNPSSPRPSSPPSSPSGGSKPAAKPDDKGGGIGGRLGGIAGRFGGGGDKDSKSASSSSKPASSSSGSGIGGRLGGITGRFGGGDKDSKPSSSGSKPASSSGGGLLGGITGRFGGGDKSSAASSSSQRPGVSSPSSASRPGSSPSASASSASSAAGARRPFGSLGAATSPAKPASSTAKPAASGGRFSLPFFGGNKDAAKPARPKTSKAPKVQQEGGLTLDNKLDILGVALVLGSLALFFSTLSSTKGALTEAVNDFLSQTFGWGALAVPVIMLAIGIWLIARHFGEEAPILEPVRISGLVMIYIGLLVLMQFIDTFSYDNVSSLEGLRNIWLPISVLRGTGGGAIGAEIYYFLVSNLTEVGAFFVLLGWVIVGLMLAASLSASELAIIVISVWRSFTTARRNRQTRRLARTAELEAQQMALAASAPPAIGVSRPETEALPPGIAAPALPAVAESAPQEALPLRPERNIPITMGGRSIGTFRSGDLVGVENAPAAPGSTPQPAMPAASTASSQTTPAKPADENRAGGGLGARLRGAMPALSLPGRTAEKPDTNGAAAKPETEKPAAENAAGGLRGRLMSRMPGAKPAESETPAAASAAPDVAPPPPGGITPPPARPAAAPNPYQPQEEAPVRLGSLLSGASGNMPPARHAGANSPVSPSASPSSPARPMPPARTPGETMPDRRAAPPEPAKPFGTPFEMPAASMPMTAAPPDSPPKTEEELEAERLAKLPPATPRGTGPLPRPEDALASRFAPTTFGSKPPTPATASKLDDLRSLADDDDSEEFDDDLDEMDDEEMEAAKPASPASLSDRMSRLNEIRAGQTATPMKPEDMATAAAYPSDKPSPAAPRPYTPGTMPERQQPAASAVPFSLDDKPAETPRRDVFTPPSTPPVAPARPAASVINAAQPRGTAPTPPPRRNKEWKLPDSSTLLMPGSEQDFDREVLLARARLIEDTLQSFGAPGKVVEVNTGPVITQFGVEPDYLVTRGGKKNRVKVSAIAQLDKDLQLALGAKAIRIEAPVPGKGYVGVEVPNEQASLVSLRDVMDSEEFKKIDSPLAIALGQSVDGAPISADLTTMPHLLIAGTTGSGKSVCVNAIIASLLIHNPPDRVKFIMVDPKRVELTGYNGIPHLVAPVVVELERIVGVLKWVTREMDERYKRFSNAGARNIEDFNKHLPSGEEMMPYIVVIIDELADLMMLAPDETERVITRIAALARATGIHLVIATQRPSVDVVTGLIKANFPARIAFAVAGGVDSRVILDQPGAERLLGRGDMLYMSGDSPAPVRLQGVYVSDTEINNITRYWKQQGDGETQTRPITALVLDNTVAESGHQVVPTPNNRPTSPQQQAFWDRESASRSSVTAGPGSLGVGSDSSDDEDEGGDEMYEEAVELVRRLGKASVSLLQRRLRIGYTRAARLIDMMEEEGIIGPAESGSKPREVLPDEK